MGCNSIALEAEKKEREMQKVYIELEQDWDTIQEAITYFESVAKDLKCLMGLPNIPTNLYLEIKPLERVEGYTCILTNS